VESEKELQKWLRNAALVILALVLVLAFVFFQRLQRKRRQKETELAAAQNDLAALTQGFREKSDMVENLHLEMDKLAASGERSHYLEQLTHSVILTDDDWAQFRAVFEKVHPDFIAAQKTAHPDLTPAELRFLVLEKLDLNAHEMANMLGVSVNTVYKTGQRLRRKTGA
jgi:DNA-binding transcriptional regulator YiaG